MARKQLTFTIPGEGRDKGKVFIITEMPAAQAEKWAIRLLLALAKGGIDVPDSAMQSGMAGLAKVALELLVKIPYTEAEPLLDEMMGCLALIPDPSKPVVTRVLIEDDIEEVMTFILLRKEILNLHVGFFTDGGQSTSAPAPARRSGASVSIKTSP